MKNYYEVRDWLEDFIPQVYGKKELGLARIENLLKLLGDPQTKFRSILIAGTSGKGSTAFYIARLLEFSENSGNSDGQKRQRIRKSEKLINLKIQNSESSEFSGKKIGLHISPHLVYIGDRMQINEKPIAVKRIVGLVNQIEPVIDAIGVSQPELLPSYFEILVALSFLYFAKEKVDIAIVEVGLGGRLDATNVLQPLITVITNVGLDHTELLGDTIEKIAKEKAGIIKPATTVITGANGKALKVIEKVAKIKKAPLINIYTQGIKNLRKIDIFRSITKPNDIYRYIPYFVNQECALLALTTVLELKLPLSKDLIKKAFSVNFPGRFEEIDENVIVDGAHNLEKIKVLVNFLHKSKVKGQKSKVVLVIAFKKGKNWQGMIDLLIKNLPIKKIITTQYFATTDMGKGSAVNAEEIKDFIDLKWKVKVESIRNSQKAAFVALGSDREQKSSRVKDLVLVTGSLYLVGEVRTLWKLPEF